MGRFFDGGHQFGAACYKEYESVVVDSKMPLKCTRTGSILMFSEDPSADPKNSIFKLPLSEYGLPANSL